MYVYVCVCRGGFRHGQTGQPPGAAFFHVTWGAGARGFLLFIISVCGELAQGHKPFRLLQAPLLAETVPCSIFVCRRQLVAVLVPWADGVGDGTRFLQVINLPWAHNVLRPPLCVV